jgi:methylthioribulose-1-phosphate dehydratase
MSNLEQRIEELVEAGLALHAQGLVPATSGNFSARLDNGNYAITVSGRHKGKLEPTDIMRIDADGKSLDHRRPSAETMLHIDIYNRYAEAQLILHPHSVSATVLSRLSGHEVVLSGYEILKAFPGIDTHNIECYIPVLDNDQDISRLAKKVATTFTQDHRLPCYIIRGHGYYTWGDSLDAVLRHVEALEFLFECELRLRGIRQ